MGVGYLGLADQVRHTAPSEWGERGTAITTLQDHHTAYPNDEGSYQLMLPGGRTVSANYLLLRDATLVEVVPGDKRAFTSASAADRYSLTVETVNQTGAPGWGISEAQRRRLAKLHADMKRAGLPTTPGKRGVGGLIGHNETPGSYATACPGPDMNNDHIAAMAAADYAGGGNPDAPTQEDDDMAFERVVDPRSGMLYFKDELGTEQVAQYVSSDMGNGEAVGSLDLLFGPYQQLAPGAEQRLFDVGMAIASRRVAAYRNRLLTDITTALKPLFDAVGIDQSKVDEAVQKAIDASDVTVDLDYEKIAEVVVDEDERRERARLDGEV